MDPGALAATLLTAATLGQDPAPSAEVAPPTPPPPAVPTTRGADRPPRERRDPTWDTWGTVRGRFDGGSDPVLDRTGTTAGRSWWFSSRVIAGADWRPIASTRVDLEVEALNGAFAGQKTDVGEGLGDDTFRVSRSDYGDLQRVLPRKLAVTFTHPKAGRFALGVQTFSWGTGMLANGGAGDPTFGDAWQGNVNARVAWLAAPFQASETASDLARGFAFFLAGDLVLRDDNASLFEGDLAAAGIVGLRLDHPRASGGLLGVVRWQRDREDPYHPATPRPETLAFPVDAYARVTLGRLDAPRTVTLEAEGALLTGRTQRPYGEETLDGARLLGGGLVARARYDDDDARLTVTLEAGLATGDDDSRDGVVRQFSLHTDHNVGLILFDHLLPQLAARAVDRVSDPALVAVPPPGLRHTVPQGGVTNAVYLYPTVRWRPLPDLDLRAGAVIAWSLADVVDLYESAQLGGYNVTPGGVAGGSHMLGVEGDLGLRYTFHFPHGLGLALGAEGGLLLPGAAFDGLARDTLGLGRARLDLLW